MKTSDIAEACRLGEFEAGDRWHQRNGSVPGQHVGDQQVDDEGLQAGVVLQRSWHVVGEPALGPGSALGAVLDLGVNATLNDLKHDVVYDAALPFGGGDAGQVGAASVVGLNGDRLLNDGLLEVVARLQVRLLQQNGDQDAEQGEQDPERGIDLVAYLAGRARHPGPSCRRTSRAGTCR